MNRLELFQRVYADEMEDVTPIFKADYAMLRELWETIPTEFREALFNHESVKFREDEFLDFGLVKIPISPKATNVRDVVEQFAYRQASAFCIDLPPFFRQVMMLADDPDMMDTLFFGTLGALSAAMPNVSGSLFGERIEPNLFIFVTGPAASGKGKIGLCRKLLEPLSAKFDSEFIIPANTSDTAFYEELYYNKGRGIIFESEADTLSQAFKKGSGKFSDGLRCGFHNEPIAYLRRANHERVVINHPVFSVVLTGTPGQVPLLFDSPENGLFSRFLFYRLSGNKESYSDASKEVSGINGKMLADYMSRLGEDVRDFYDELQHKAGGVEFYLSDDQYTQFMSHFHDETIRYRELFIEAYGNETAGENATSIMNRMGNICYRMMMILTVSRLMASDEGLPKRIVCDNRDFDYVMDLEPKLRLHNTIHYDEMMVANKSVLPLGEENVEVDESSDDGMNAKQRDFYCQLPNEFTTQSAMQTAKNIGISSRSVARYLSFYCDLGLLKCLYRGVYRKIEDKK